MAPQYPLTAIPLLSRQARPTVIGGRIIELKLLNNGDDG